MSDTTQPERKCVVVEADTNTKVSTTPLTEDEAKKKVKELKEAGHTGPLAVKQIING
jgi:hypothetical protein